MENFIRYDFKMYIGRTTDILCFHAYIVEDPKFAKPSIDIKELDNFEIDELSQSLFYDIVEGRLSFDLISKRGTIDTKDILKNIETITINEGSAIKNLKKFQNYSQDFFGLTVELSSFSLKQPFSLRYDGYSYNIGHGVRVGKYDEVDEFTKDFISTVSANNTNFGDMYRKIEIASSTIIPFESERIDTKALKTIVKVFNDINNDQIDYEYISNHSDDYGQLYKKLLITLPTIRKIDELDVFEIIIDDKKYPLDLDKAKKIKYDEYGTSVTLNNLEFKYYKGELENDISTHSLEVLHHKKRKTLHLDSSNQSLIDIVTSLKKGDKINITGITLAKRTVLVDTINQRETT